MSSGNDLEVELHERSHEDDENDMTDDNVRKSLEFNPDHHQHNPVDQEQNEEVAHKKFIWLIGLRPDIKHRNMLVLILDACILMSVSIFVSAISHFLLETFLSVPKSEQSKVVGDLTFYTELILILFAWMFGVLSDKLGTRKPLIVVGCVVMSICVGCLPVAKTILVLTLIRIMFGVGASLSFGMLAASIADYTVTRDRGKSMAVFGVFVGVGSVLGLFVYLSIPNWLITLFNISDKQSGFITFSIMACIALSMAVANLLLLHRGIRKQTNSDTSIDGRQDDDVEERSFSTIFIDGFKCAVTIPDVLLSYCGMFVGRGDATIISTFVSLWVSQEMLADGFPESQGLTRAGIAAGCAQGFVLIASPFFGFVIDRFDRVLTLAAVSMLAGVGYMSVFFLPKITSNWSFLSLAIIGTGECGVFLVSATMGSQAAPKRSRGAIIGLSNVFGNVGVLFISKVGGYIYSFNPAYPFIMVGFLNLVLTGICVVVKFVSHFRSMQGAVGQQ
ncbi:12 TM domain-containing transmembrane protein [Acrasis kona]|uniref:12 TM domain-containing transmembrane protein n=1 Tax=Acrasis kona TaxID=1008807 RepID=A0AAW2Z5G2_9EUKA